MSSLDVSFFWGSPFNPQPGQFPLSTRELETAIRRYIDLTNERPKRFKWTKTADEILTSIARFCHRISHSGH